MPAHPKCPRLLSSAVAASKPHPLSTIRIVNCCALVSTSTVTCVARPCLRATIQKTEVRGPKTSPFVVYMLHVRTAFTVRGLARRYSDFVMLDGNLRAHFVNR